MSQINQLEISERTQSFTSTNSLIILPKQTYHILAPWYIYLLSIMFVVGGLIFLVIGIVELVKGEDFNIHNFILFVVLIVISCVFTYFFPFYSSITIDMEKKSVVVKKYKLIFIKKKVTNLITTDIVRAYTEINYSSEDGKKDKSTEDGFNLVFELKNGEKILALEGESDKNFDMIKINFFLRKFFPGLAAEESHDDNIGLDKFT